MALLVICHAIKQESSLLIPDDVVCVSLSPVHLSVLCYVIDVTEYS